MESMPVASPSPPARFRLQRRWIVIALLLVFVVGGTVLALVVAAGGSGTTDTRPGLFTAGTVDGFEINQPVHFADQQFWLVRRSETEFLALYRKDPNDACTVPWRSDFDSMGWKGWFRNPCHAQTYDVAGRGFSGPCDRGLDRFPVRVVNGEVVVDTTQLIPGPALGPEYQSGN